MSRVEDLARHRYSNIRTLSLDTPSQNGRTSLSYCPGASDPRQVFSPVTSRFVWNSATTSALCHLTLALRLTFLGRDSPSELSADLRPFVMFSVFGDRQ
jgi:hypothetical protein